MTRRLRPLLLLLALPACYAYATPARDPDPGMRVALDINDAGRVALAGGVGPGAERVEGRLVSRSDSLLRLRVTGVRYREGTTARWNGEELAVRAEHVTSTRERRLSRGRTLAFAAAGAAAILVLALTTNFDIFGLPFGGDGDGPGGGGPDQ